MNTQRGRGLYALSVILAALTAASCLFPTGIEVWKLEAVIYKGEAAGHSEALAKWAPLQKDYMYLNIIDNCVYRYSGQEWVLATGNQPVIPSSVVIDGAYIPPRGAYYPVRMYFTDGSVADGYISSGYTAAGDVVLANKGRIMLYDDHWNDRGTQGKIYHTLTVLDISGSIDKVNETILLGRKFDMSDDVVLDINEERKLQPRTEMEHPNETGVLYTPIYTVEELRWIDDTSTSRGKNYLQMADLDLLGNPPEPNGGIPKLEKHNWVPLGPGIAYDNPFTGTFDGNGKEIRNLYVKTTSTHGAGLFRFVEEGTLTNITIASGSVTAASNAGGIVGVVRRNTTITACVNNAGITLDGNEAAGLAGGIAGTITEGTITNCGNTGSITVANKGMHTGGIAGRLSFSTVSTCFNKGEGKGKGESGGIAGLVDDGTTISACYNTGTVSAPPSGPGSTYQNIGGLAGRTTGTVSITASYSTGLVDGGESHQSWLIGVVGGYVTTMSDCYYLYRTGSPNYPGQSQLYTVQDGLIYATGNAAFSDQDWPSPGWDPADWKDGSLDSTNWDGGNNGLASAFPKLRWEEP